MKVKALFDGTVAYRGSLANMGQGVPVLGTDAGGKESTWKRLWR
ncbi:hypothetical protein [Bergeyella porcorum]